MLGALKEKLRISVYKVLVVKKAGTHTISKRVEYYEDEHKKIQKKEVDLFKRVEVTRYRIVKIKHVNPNREYFKHTMGGFLSSNRITKYLPIDFQYEAYCHNEKHVMFIDWDTGAALKMGGGSVEYSFQPEEEAKKSSLMRSVGDLLRGRMDTAIVLMALGLGVFLGIFIQNTVIPLLG